MRHVPRSESAESGPFTLLDLVGAVSEVARDDDEALAVLLHLIGSGRVRLARDRPAGPSAD